MGDKMLKLKKKLKSESGMSSIFVDDKTRKFCIDNSLTLRALLLRGMQSFSGMEDNPKIAFIVEKLSEESQKRVEIEGKFRKIIRKLHESGEKIEEWLK
jgi:hypothetical protein